jgi:hypothetical protein
MIMTPSLKLRADAAERQPDFPAGDAPECYEPGFIIVKPGSRSGRMAEPTRRRGKAWLKFRV